MPSINPIYLDYNATTPIDPAVLEAMLPYLRTHFGNPSSTHVLGRTAHDAVERARAQVASLLRARGDEIIFTAGGTEASNQAILGVVFAKLQGLFARWFAAPHVVTSAIEHPATLKPCEFLRSLGCKVTLLPVDRQGVVDREAFRQAMRSKPTLVSIMHSNNEVGTLQPIAELAKEARTAGAVFHTDVAQSVGKLRFNVDELGVDFLSIAGHKLYAPKGVGVLYARRGVPLRSFIHGAGHEAGRRAGTENVPYIVALGQACEIAERSLPDATEKLTRLRERLWERLRAGLGERVVLNGHPTARLPNTLNVNFVGQVGAELLARTPEVAASTGSACHEGQISQSPVLCAMKVPPELGQGAVRLSVGRFTTEAEVDAAAEALLRQAVRG